MNFRWHNLPSHKTARNRACQAGAILMRTEIEKCNRQAPSLRSTTMKPTSRSLNTVTPSIKLSSALLRPTSTNWDFQSSSTLFTKCTIVVARIKRLNSALYSSKSAKNSEIGANSISCTSFKCGHAPANFYLNANSYTRLRAGTCTTIISSSKRPAKKTNPLKFSWYNLMMKVTHNCTLSQCHKSHRRSTLWPILVRRWPFQSVNQ